MVCAKCEKKLAKSSSSSLACTDVWKPTGATGDRNARKVGENKLLSSKARYSPYAPTAGSSKGAAKASGSGVAGRETGTFGQCETCKTTVTRVGAKYCQGCAYKKGVCALCAKSILDTSMYKMTAK